MNAKNTRTPKSTNRPLRRALLALSVAAAVWPAVSLAGEKRSERPVPRQVAMTDAASTANAASVQALVSRQAEEQAFNVIRRNVSVLDACYQRAAAGGGKLEVSFEVGPSGRATDIQVKSTALQNTSVPGCVSAALARWSFPASARARVSFPLLFVTE